MKPLTRKQLAEFLSVSVRTVDNYVAAGRIAHLKIAGQVRFTEAHIAAFEKAHTVKAGN